MKINIGCGTTNFGDDWYHIDQRRFPHVDSELVYCENIPHDSVDLIYASHFLEYFSRPDAHHLLESWFKRLKPGGCIRLAVPDFEVISRLYTTNKYTLDAFVGPLYGRMFDNKCGVNCFYHKTVYDFDSLSKLMRQSELINIDRWDWQQAEHSHIDDCSQAYLPHMHKLTGTLISLNVQGFKYG